MLLQIILANIWGRHTLDLYKLFWKIEEEEPLPISFYFGFNNRTKERHDNKKTTN